MPLHLRGIIRTVTGGHAVVRMPGGTQRFRVAPNAVADVLKAVLAQARVAITVQHGEIVGAELSGAVP
jgi:hypothetical protein